VATHDTQQLPPGATIGMAIGTEIAPADPAPLRTVWIGAEMVRGVDLTAASSRHDDARGWGCRGVWVGVARIGTGVAVRLGGEAHKGFRLAAALAPWGWGSGVVKHAPTESPSHPPWSMLHSHSRATSTNWEKKRWETMAPAPHIGEQ
jgi:hypothetical protein